MSSIKAGFTIKDLEFSEAEFGEISDEFEKKIKERMSLSEIPPFLKIEFVIENVSGLSEFIKKQEDINILEQVISINADGDFPVISLDITADLILNNQKNIDDFIEFFENHDDKNDLISVFIEDTHNEEEYFPDFIDEIYVQILN